MATTQTASLILNTYNCSSNNLNRTELYWDNVDLRILLGDMFDKYDLFNLNLSSIGQGYSNDFLGANNKLSCNIRISGLPFVNNTCVISASNTSKTSIATFNCFEFFDNNSVVVNYRGYDGFTFSKQQYMCNIKIDYQDINTMNLPTVEADDFPHMTFHFNIFGVESSKSSDVKRRI